MIAATPVAAIFSFGNTWQQHRSYENETGVFFCLIGLLTFLLPDCRTDVPVINAGASGYPDDVGKIILVKCVNSGCHNTQSKDAAAGLDLSSWSRMFQGDRSGNSVTVPYSHLLSTTFLFTNTYSDLGIFSSPAMPLSNSPLSRTEVNTLRNWIDRGAPDRTGFVMFSDNPSRKKFYAVNQGCDLVTVFDQKTLLPMRFIQVGGSGFSDSPCMIRVSPDGKYWYLSFANYPYFQRYRTDNDEYAGQIYVGNDQYTAFTISNDSRKAFCTGYNSGKIATIDLDNFVLSDTLQGFGSSTLHGAAFNPSGSYLYALPSFGNFVIRLDPANLSSFSTFSLDGNPVSTASSLNPHEITFSPDGSKYYVTCQSSNEVRVMDALTNLPLHTIQFPLAAKPQEMSISPSRNLLFVSCMEDSVTFPGMHGSVYAINMTTYASTATNTGYQPHGLVADESNGLVYVGNRNVCAKGPASHHSTMCGGKNGYVTIIDMNTMQLLPGKRIELTTDVYSLALRP